MMAKSFDEAIELYYSGVVTRLEMYALFIRLLTLENVDASINSLPTEIRDDFIEHATRIYRDSRDEDLVTSGPPVPDVCRKAIRDWLNRHPPSNEFRRRLDREFYDILGAERANQFCREEGCDRGAIEHSLFCRVHHFEMVKRRPCPFDD
jgi:hypothetical protein